MNKKSKEWEQKVSYKFQKKLLDVSKVDRNIHAKKK